MKSDSELLILKRCFDTFFNVNIWLAQPRPSLDPACLDNLLSHITLTITIYLFSRSGRKIFLHMSSKLILR